MDTRHAIVIGGGVAGLCAARALAPSFERVSVIERRPRPAATTPGDAPGPPSFEALLARGRVELERLFPGVDERLRARGAVQLDVRGDVAAVGRSGLLRREPSGIPALLASRALLEATLRDELRGLANVVLLDGLEVRRLRLDPGGDYRLAGVVARAADGTEQVLGAGFVVDASGRGSRAPEWLGALGPLRLDERTVDGGLAVSTRWFGARAVATGGCKGMWLEPHPPRAPRGALLLPIEGRRWVVCIFTPAGQEAPADEAGFAAALGTLAVPLLARWLRRARPLSAVRVARDTANRFRHYEHCWTLPRGFFATGDAVCALNPLYGLAASCAAVSAGVLAEELAAHGAGDPFLSFRLLAAQARFLRGVWTLAAAADSRFPGAAGPRAALARLTAGYLRAVLRAAGRDRALRQAVAETLQLRVAPSALFAGPIARRVLGDALRRRLPSAGAGTAAVAPEAA